METQTLTPEVTRHHQFTNTHSTGSRPVTHPTLHKGQCLLVRFGSRVNRCTDVTRIGAPWGSRTTTRAFIPPADAHLRNRTCAIVNSATLTVERPSGANVSFHEFIGTNRDELIRRCEGKAARTPPPPAKATDHGVPLFLDQLVKELREGSSQSYEIARPRPSTGTPCSSRGSLSPRSFTTMVPFVRPSPICPWNRTRRS